MSGNYYLPYCVGVISLGTLQFGYNMAELNEPREAMSCFSATAIPGGKLPSCIPMAPWQIGLVTSIFAIGGLLGALTAAPLTNRNGRRSALVLNSFGFIIGGVMKAAAPNVAVLALGRFISGLSSGVAVVIVPLYVNEIAPADAKGKYGGVTQISINIGILSTQILGMFLSKPQLWRLILIVGTAIGALQAALLLGLPESPKFLLAKVNKQAARDSLSRIRGRDADIEDELREAEPLTQSDDEGSQVSTWSFLTDRSHRKQALVVCGLMFAQQITGINSVIFHGVSVLKGLLPDSAGYINVLISLGNLVFTTGATFFFDKFRHKHILLASFSGMALFAFLLAIGIFKRVPILSAISCFMFVASFSVGVGPLPWMVASKTVDFRAVDAAQSSGLVTNWIGTFIVGLLVPVISDAVGMEWVFLGFGFIGAFTVFAVWKGVGVY